MDDYDESPTNRPKPSKTPSWIMLGFVLGALFVSALPRQRAPVPATPAPTPVAAELRPAPGPGHPRLSDVEAVFSEWRGHAVWADDVTYVCVWDSESKTFRDCFEVLRRSDGFFFRSILRPRNLRALEGIPAHSPLEFLNPVPVARGLFGEPLVKPSGFGEKISRPADTVPGQ